VITRLRGPRNLLRGRATQRTRRAGLAALGLAGAPSRKPDGPRSRRLHEAADMKLALSAALFAAATALFPARASAEEAVPPPPAFRYRVIGRVDPPQPSSIRKPPMVAAGVVVIIIGTAMTVAGAAILASIPGQLRACQSGGGDDCGVGAGLGDLLGGGLLGPGLLHLAVGIPLVAVGAQSPSPEPSPFRGPEVPAPRASARTVSLSWAF
jgi:hypothetical protein